MNDRREIELRAVESTPAIREDRFLKFRSCLSIVLLRLRHGQWSEQTAHMRAWFVGLLVLGSDKDERVDVPKGVQESELVNKFGRSRGGEAGGCVGEVW